MEETKTAAQNKEQIRETIEFYLDRLSERELCMVRGFVQGLKKASNEAR